MLVTSLDLGQRIENNAILQDYAHYFREIGSREQLICHGHGDGEQTLKQKGADENM